jgi:Ras-related protein Rab-1A
MFRNLLKVILIGDTEVGKTKLLLRFTDGTFTPESMTTIGVDFKEKAISIQGAPWRLQIWDTAGQERFKTITQSYYRRARGALVVFDLSQIDTFNNVENWLNSLTQINETAVPVILIGNKCDLVAQVSEQQIQDLTNRHKLTFFKTSALTGEGINEAFQLLTERIVTQTPIVTESKEESPASVTLEKEKKKKKGCC